MSERPDIRTLAGAIAKALGATLLPLRKDRDDDQWQRIATPEGPELTLHYTSYPKLRLVASFNLPKYTDRNGESRDQFVKDLDYILQRMGTLVTPDREITADPGRGADKIAADIRRRLLPGAILCHQAALTRKAEYEAHATGVNSTMARLCKELKHTPHEYHKGREELYLDAVRVQVSSPDSVRFESFYVDTDTAIAIYKLIEAHKASKRGTDEE